MFTLVGRSLAEDGCEYFQGRPTEECRGCRYVQFCFNLKEGRVFRVVRRRKVDHECPIHEGGRVIAVDVTETGISVGVDADMAIPGSSISLDPWVCPRVGCSNHAICSCRGILPGTRLRVKERYEGLTCPLGMRRRRVSLEFLG